MIPWLTENPARAAVVIVLACALPVWLLLSSVQLVMTDAYLAVEYGKPDFPPDLYGFTQADRLAYAPYALQYLRNNQDDDSLAALTLPDGRAMYTARELSHMADVKVVTQAALNVHLILTAGLVVLVLLVGRRAATRPWLWRGLFSGGLLTLALLGGIALIVLLNWDFFFEEFHRIFFAEGSWRFQYSDTLIRLFPERFWVDAAVTVGLLAAGGAIVLGGIAFWRARSRG